MKKNLNEKKFLFVANWKMQKNYQDSVAFITKHLHELNEMSSSAKQLVICPSFVTLPFFNALEQRAFAFGAQDCSAQESGAYTGQVDAASLAQVGCTYCIVGHSEQRMHCNESNEVVAHKVIQLLKHAIIPIVCIGEPYEVYKSKKTENFLAEQLMPIVEAVKKNKNTPVYLAYEPLWAIGTGITPSFEYLVDIFNYLQTIFENHSLTAVTRYIYGGSVSEETISDIQKAPVDGVLIGNASLDFKKLKNIVSLHTLMQNNY